MDAFGASQEGTGGRLSIRSLVWIVVFGATLLQIDLGPGWVLTYHEVFCAEPAREILRTGDWIVPRVLGVACWQKPPLISWVIAGSMAVFRSESEWVVRLPIILASLLNALAIAALAARWHGDRIGRITGLIQLTMFYNLFQSRLAEADMLLCATVTGAMVAFGMAVVGREEERPARWWVVLYFGLAVLAFLTKGPIGPAFIGGGCGLFAILQRRRTSWRFLLDPVGWAILIVGMIAWPLAAYWADPSIVGAFREQNLDRFNGTLGGRENPFYYLYVIPGLLLPWTPAVVGGLWIGRREGDRPAGSWRFLGCWFGVGLALISASAWKHKHYAIPALPPLSILAAVGVERYVFGSGARRRLLAPIAASALIGAGLGTYLVGHATRDDFLMALAPLIASAGLGLGVAFGLHRSGRPGYGLAAVFGTAWATIILVQSTIMPAHDNYREQERLARRVNAGTTAGEPICLMMVPEPQITFYLRFPMERYNSWAPFVQRAERALAEGRSLAIVTPERLHPHLARLGTLEIHDRAPVAGHVTSTAERLTFLTLRPEPARVAAVRSQDLAESTRR